MKAEDFLRDVGEITWEPRPTDAAIALSRDRWTELLSVLDYQRKKWFAYDSDYDEWDEISFGDVCEVFEGFGITNESGELDQIVRQMRYRDEEAAVRHDSDSDRAQLRFGI
jgi:hypothetical protein